MTIQLYVDSNNNGTLDSSDSLVATQVTAAGTGAYAFTGVTPNKRYFVQEVTPTDYIRTAPAVNTYYTINASAGGSYTGNDFANFHHGNCASYLSNIYYTVNNGCTQYTDLSGNTNQGDLVTVHFTVASGGQSTVSLVSYTAPSQSFDYNTAYLQKIFDLGTGTFGPGTYTLTVQIPNSYYQVDFVCGPAIDQFGPNGSNIFYHAENRFISSDNDGCQAVLTHPGSLSGVVYADANFSGTQDSGEPGIGLATVTLVSTDGCVSLTRYTKPDGSYIFDNLPAKTYKITLSQPSGTAQGTDTAGTLGGVVGTNAISSIVVSSGGVGVNYAFATVTPRVACHDYATTGFWKNTSGQNLIKSLNGSSSSTALATWLVANFPNLFGSSAGVYSMVNSNGTKFTNSQVASSYKTNFYNPSSGTSANVNILAAALSVYVTSSTLSGGTYAASSGFNVTASGTGSDSVSLGSNAAAFANKPFLSVMMMLQSVDSQAVNGVLYSGKSQQSAWVSMAQSAFSSSVNTAGGLAMLAQGTTLGDANDADLASGAMQLSDLLVYVDDTQGNITTDEEARIEDAIATLNTQLGSLGLQLIEVGGDGATSANITISVKNTTSIGGVANGVLGLTEMGGTVTLVSGWNWFAGSDPSQIGFTQYDFQTVATHELGHAIGLGHSTDQASAMFPYLTTGEYRHTLTANDVAAIGQYDLTRPEALTAQPLCWAGLLPSAVHSNLADAVFQNVGKDRGAAIGDGTVRHVSYNAIGQRSLDAIDSVFADHRIDSGESSIDGGTDQRGQFDNNIDADVSLQLGGFDREVVSVR